MSRKYGYNVPAIVDAYHSKKMTDNEYKMLEPLLSAQPYINRVIATDDSAMVTDYDLDSFRSIMWRSFHGNYVAGYFTRFNIPYTEEDLITPWLTAEPKKVAPIVVARTFRYRSTDSEKTWKQFVSIPNFYNASVFFGNTDEHADFEKTFDVKVRHYKPTDFLEMAQIIAGAEHIISNQTFVYSLAQGLGKNTALETIPDRTLERNECFFKRDGCLYF